MQIQKITIINSRKLPPPGRGGYRDGKRRMEENNTFSPVKLPAPVCIYRMQFHPPSPSTTINIQTLFHETID